MPVKDDIYGDVCVLSIDGDLSGDNVQASRTLVEKMMVEKLIVDFAIDFEKCPFIDSEGLEMLLWIKRRVDEGFGRVKLAVLDDHCRKIIEMTRLENHFECHGDLTQALQAMR
jgi:anti-anti-sigma factor